LCRVILSATRSRNKNGYRKYYRDYTESHEQVTKFIMRISCVDRALWSNLFVREPSYAPRSSDYRIAVQNQSLFWAAIKINYLHVKHGERQNHRGYANNAHRGMFNVDEMFVKRWHVIIVHLYVTVLVQEWETVFVTGAENENIDAFDDIRISQIKWPLMYAHDAHNLLYVVRQQTRQSEWRRNAKRQENLLCLLSMSILIGIQSCT